MMTCIRCGKPKHLGITPSRNLVHCFKCGYADGLTNFLKEINIVVDNMGGDGRIEYVEERAVAPTLEEIKLPEASVSLPDDSFLGRAAMKYLTGKRGLTLEQITRYKLGYCSSGYFFGRIIIPMYENGILVYYEGKAFLPHKKKTKNPFLEEPGVVKYPGMEYIKNGKSQILFNIDCARRFERCVIVEGFFDAAAVGDDAVAILGHEISDIQFYKLLKCRFKEYVVWLDADAKREALTLGKRLSGFAKTKIVLMDRGDPDEYKGSIREIIDGAPEFSDELYLTQSMV